MSHCVVVGAQVLNSKGQVFDYVKDTTVSTHEPERNTVYTLLYADTKPEPLVCKITQDFFEILGDDVNRKMWFSHQLSSTEPISQARAIIRKGQVWLAIESKSGVRAYRGSAESDKLTQIHFRPPTPLAISGTLYGGANGIVYIEQLKNGCVCTKPLEPTGPLSVITTDMSSLKTDNEASIVRDVTACMTTSEFWCLLGNGNACVFARSDRGEVGWHPIVRCGGALRFCVNREWVVFFDRKYVTICWRRDPFTVALHKRIEHDKLSTLPFDKIVDLVVSDVQDKQGRVVMNCDGKLHVFYWDR